MDRIADIDQSRVLYWRNDYQNQPAYAAYSKPCPATVLKHDDDVLWLGVLPVRVIWGTDDPNTFLAYGNDFGDTAAPLEHQYITDRAPADPEETPMPIAAQQQRQAQHTEYNPKKAVQRLLKHLAPEPAKKVRALFKERKPELLDDDERDTKPEKKK